MRNSKPGGGKLPAWSPPSPATNSGLDPEQRKQVRAARRNRFAVRAWATFGSAVATAIGLATLIPDGVSLNGFPALLGILLFISIPVSLIVAVFATVRALLGDIADWFTKAQEPPAPPQDAVR